MAFNNRMMKARHILFLLLATVGAAAAQGQIRVGEWRSHLSYHHVHSVQAAGEHVYAAAAQGMLRVSRTTGQAERMDKTTGLTDVGISVFAYDSATRSLVIGYANSNVDILQGGETFNVSDIRRSALAGDKSIRRIRFHGGRAYLACAFGVVTLDLQRMEIRETFYPPVTPLNDIAFVGDTLLAATAHGLLRAPLSANLATARAWRKDTTSLLAMQPVQHIEVTAAGVTLAATYDSATAQSVLYASAGGDAFAPLPHQGVRGVRATRDHVLVCLQDSLLLLTPRMGRIRAFGAMGWMSMSIDDADMDEEGTLWLAHDWAGLVECNPDRGRLQGHSPEGPWTDDIYRLTADGDRLLLCLGGKSATGVNANIGAVLGIFQDEEWHNVHPGGADTLRDLVSVAANPNDRDELLAASWGQGIVRIAQGRIAEVYNEGNTGGALGPYSEGGFRSLRTGDICFDRGGNAWMTNSLVQHGIVERRRDGTWHKYSVGSLFSETDIDRILFDTVNGLLWFYGRPNRLCAIHVDGDGNTQLAYVNPNNGSKVNTTAVTCLAQDHDGYLWMGTDKGVKKIYDGSKVFELGGQGEQSPVTCSNILISEGDMAEYLMAYESVTCLAVDGANRKWVGTANGGLYLLSANGLTQLEHFTFANSPLFSNKIVSLAINPHSGELFVGTDKGLQSFRATATYATSESDEHIYAYPNPVPPGYGGLVAIKGFSRNALVHVTDVAGHTVFSTTAHGGQAVWDRRTNSGQEVASGVYFVFASNEEGKMRAVTKILIVR